MKTLTEFINEAITPMSRREFDDIMKELETEWKWNIYDMADNYNRTPEQFIMFLANKHK